MDPAIAPMAADAFSRMANDAGHPTDPESQPPVEGKPEERGNTE
jgi:hypothetical protein